MNLCLYFMFYIFLCIDEIEINTLMFIKVLVTILSYLQTVISGKSYRQLQTSEQKMLFTRRSAYENCRWIVR
jgi:hypothetical protein